MESRQPDDLRYIGDIIAKVEEFIQSNTLVLPINTQFVDSPYGDRVKMYDDEESKEYIKPAYKKTDDASGRLYVKIDDKYYASSNDNPTTLSHCLNFTNIIKRLVFVKDLHEVKKQEGNPQHRRAAVSSWLDGFNKVHAVIGKNSGVINAAASRTLFDCFTILAMSRGPISQNEAQALLKKHRVALEAFQKRIEEGFGKMNVRGENDKQIIPIILSALRAIAESTPFNRTSFGGKISPTPSEAIVEMITILLKTGYRDNLVKCYVTDPSLHAALTDFFNDMAIPPAPPLPSVATHHSTTFSSASSSSSVRQSTPSPAPGSANTAAGSSSAPPQPR